MDSLPILGISDPFIVFVNAIGAYRADMPSVPFDFEPVTTDIILTIFPGFVIFRPAFPLSFRIRVLFFPGSIPVFPFTLHGEPTHIVLNVGLDHIPKDDIFKFNSHNELL